MSKAFNHQIIGIVSDSYPSAQFSAILPPQQPPGVGFGPAPPPMIRSVDSDDVVARAKPPADPEDARVGYATQYDVV